MSTAQNSPSYRHGGSRLKADGYLGDVNVGDVGRFQSPVRNFTRLGMRSARISVRWLGGGAIHEHIAWHNAQKASRMHAIGRVAPCRLQLLLGLHRMHAARSSIARRPVIVLESVWLHASGRAGDPPGVPSRPRFPMHGTTFDRGTGRRQPVCEFQEGGHAIQTAGPD